MLRRGILAGLVVCAVVLVASAPTSAREAGSAGSQNVTSELRTRLAQALSTPGVDPARTGALAVDVQTGQVVFQHNPSLPLAPASAEKLVVAFTALRVLGTSLQVPHRGARPRRAPQARLGRRPLPRRLRRPDAQRRRPERARTRGTGPRESDAFAARSWVTSSTSTPDEALRAGSRRSSASSAPRCRRSRSRNCHFEEWTARPSRPPRRSPRRSSGTASRCRVVRARGVHPLRRARSRSTPRSPSHRSSCRWTAKATTSLRRCS